MKPGTPFKAIVMGAFDDPTRDVDTPSVRFDDQRSREPCQVHRARGETQSAHLLELDFTSCKLPGGEAVACESTLASVDNARENVLKGGRIQGILTATCRLRMSSLSRVRYRPGTALSGRSATGLTGDWRQTAISNRSLADWSGGRGTLPADFVFSVSRTRKLSSRSGPILSYN